MTPTGHLVVDGRRLETGWIEARTPGDPTLVLLHEGLGCVALWRDFPERLADKTGLGVFAFSRLGYGGSDPAPLPRPLSYLGDEARVTLPAVLDAAGIGEHVLIGHSDGGSIAAVHAGLHADARLRAVVLIAPHVVIEDLTVAGVRDADAALRSGNLRARLERHHGANTDIAFRGWRDLQLDPGFRSWNALSALRRVTVPLLIVQGDADPYGSPEQVRTVERHVPAAEALVLPGCGHVPHVEQPDAVLDRIAAFVSGAI